MKSVVAIARINNYDINQCYKAINYSLEQLGGLSKLIKPNSRIFIKINHLSPATTADRGIITHTSFTEALLQVLKQLDIDITVGDDISSNEGYKISGYKQMCHRLGVRLINVREAGFTRVPCNGYLLNEIYLSTAALEADYVISAAKFKTHSLTVFTGALKNMYGLIPHGLRRSLHGRYAKSEDFNQMLVDIYSVLNPQLNIIDGIVAMEGEGPSSGRLKNLGVILSGEDAVAVDAIAMKVVGLNPFNVLTTRFSDERKLGRGNPDEIIVSGDEMSPVSDFKPPISLTSSVINSMPHFLPDFIMRHMLIKPDVLTHNCTNCGECINICPTQAISLTDSSVSVNKKLCIGCMCCHEVCRFNAIMPAYSILGRILRTASSAIQMIRRIMSLNI